MKIDRTEMILDMATEGFWEWDLKNDRAFLSPRYCELIGYLPEDTIFNSTFFLSIIHPDDRDRISALVKEYLQGKRTSSVAEYRIITRDSTIRWIEERGKIVEHDESGVPVHAVGTVVDITARKEMENRLRQSEEKFATAFRSSPDAVNITRLNDGVYIEVNEGFTAISGYRPEEVIGKSALDLGIWVDPDDRGRLVDGLQASGVVNNLDASFRCKDGSTFQGLMSARVIEFDGVPCVLSITRDISDRKAKEDQISRNEALLRCIINSVVDIIFVKDTGGIYQACNKAAEDFIGLPESEQIGKSDFDLFNPELAEVIRQCDRQILQTGESRCIEERITFRNGVYGFLETTKTPYYGPDGKLLGLVGLSRDITKRKQNEEAVNNFNKLLQTVINTVPVRVFWKDAESRYLGCNQAFARDAGFDDPNELIGKKDDQMGWKDQAELYQADDRLVIESGQPRLSYDEPQTTPDGGLIWLRTSKVPLRNDANEIIGVLGMYEDITDRKQVETDKTRLLLCQRAILDNLPMMAWLKDCDSRLEMVNKPYAWACGNKTVDECIGKTDLDLFPEELARGYMADDREVCSTSRKKQVEETIITPEGTRWHLTHKTPLLDEQGRTIGTTGIAMDITDIKLAEAALRKKNDDMEQFAYTVSHDLRSPLVTIKTFLGYLESDMDADNQARIIQDLQYIHAATDKMKLLLDELLELSRIDRTEAEPVKVSLVDLLGEILDAMAGVISEQGVDIRLPKTDLILHGDRRRLCQIWQNLIENAIKYRGDDRVACIELGTRLTGEDTVFFVKDNGIGIEPQYHDKVFGIFEKLDSKTPGAGLGLSMIKRIVEKHGGRVWVESPGSDQGSCFCFILPNAVRNPDILWNTGNPKN